MGTVYIISEHDEGEQVRKHKKRRINKKWKKRYGVYHSPLKPGQIAITWNGILLMTRPTYQKVKKILSQKTDAIIPTHPVGDYFYYQPPKGDRAGAARSLECASIARKTEFGGDHEDLQRT